jgi:hypothetical protein
MALTVLDLEACVGAVSRAESSEDAQHALASVLALMRSPENVANSFFRGGSGTDRDYVATFSTFSRLFSEDENPKWARLSDELIREAVLEAFTEEPLPVLDASTPADSADDVDSVAIDSPPKVAMKEARTESSPWVLTTLAALLPLLSDALPRDANGICIIPHQHDMDKNEAQEGAPVMGGSGRLVFRTNKICDNCGARITDRYYFHCAEQCDIDFCEECYKKSQELLDGFLERTGGIDHATMRRRLFWVIDIAERIGAQVLHLSALARTRFANELAFNWPTSMFEKLVQSIIDIVNAKVVHVQDVKDIQSDERFWYVVGLLQFLYSANSLPCSTKRLDEHGHRGPKLEYEKFILEGINKCEPLSEWNRWRKHPSAKVPDMVALENFRLTPDFCSFLTHNNLVPVSFRRVCLLCDVWEQIQSSMGRVTPLQLEVRREPDKLLEDVLRVFRSLSNEELRRPLRVTFVGEDAVGPGVTREFFQVAMRSFLGCNGSEALFKHNEQQRTIWFNEDQGSDQRLETSRACGLLLGQAVLNNVLVPSIFPRVLYERLLQDLESPYAKPVGLEDLAPVSEDIARSLQRVLDYEADDIGIVFGDLDWAGAKDTELCQGNKATFVQDYVEWFFRERTAEQFEPLSQGFRTILGSSSLLRNMVDAVQLERIVCGGTVPVDMPRFAVALRWRGGVPTRSKNIYPCCGMCWRTSARWKRSTLSFSCLPAIVCR